MAVSTVDEYIAALDEPKRSTMTAVRELLLSIEPGLEQVIAWNTPQFKYNGKYVCGLAAFKNHLTFSPQSAEVMEACAADLADYVTSKSSFQFGVDHVLPRPLLEKILKLRLAELVN